MDNYFYIFLLTLTLPALIKEYLLNDYARITIA